MKKESIISRAILAIAMILAVGLPTHAHDFKVNGIYYNYIDKDAKTVEVTQGSYPGIGPIGYGNDIIIPSNVTYDGITYSVTAIGEDAFSGCTALTSIAIPNSIVSIGENAFSGCSGLTSISIPNLVTSISNSTFSGCTGLTSITIPNLVTSIGNYAFHNCTNLTSVTIPNSVTLISDYAFYGCRGLISISIPNSVCSIGNYAFSGCNGLTSISIPNSVCSIGNYAFSGCKGLTSVSIPNSVTSIDYTLLYSCSNLTSITVESGNSKYDSRDNCNAIIETATNTLISGCKSTIIPNTVTSIGEHAFDRCTGMTSISIPNSVTTIDDSAFYNCSDLTSLTLPNSITYIGQGAFGKCKFLVLHLPKSVTYVGLHNTCADICYCYNPTPPTGGGYTSDRLYVPKGSLTAYATAEGWKTAKQILEFDADDDAKPILTIAYPEGGVIKQEVDNGEILKLQIVAANGWKCHSATFNDTDVTNQIDINGYYNTPSITANSQLNIVFIKDDGGVANALIDNDIKVCVKGNIVTITGADEFSEVEIYNTAGATIYNGIDKSITLDANGIYILSIEGRTFKFSM